jgi:hypothetical protein
MTKAVREAKEQTSWRRPDEDYEQALAAFVDRLMEDFGRAGLAEDVAAFAHRLAPHGALNARAAAAQVAAPGVPDFYQGTELWSLTLVDPDNRRPVDYALRAPRPGRDLAPYRRAGRRRDARRARVVAGRAHQAARHGPRPSLPRPPPRSVRSRRLHPHRPPSGPVPTTSSPSPAPSAARPAFSCCPAGPAHGRAKRTLPTGARPWRDTHLALPSALRRTWLRSPANRPPAQRAHLATAPFGRTRQAPDSRYDRLRHGIATERLFGHWSALRALLRRA